MKKKILIFIGSFNLGGTEKQLYNLLKFIQNDYDIHVQCLQNVGDLSDKVKQLNIKVYSNSFKNGFLRKLNYFLLFFKLFSKIKKINPKIIHFFLPQSYIFGAIYTFYFKNINFLMSRRSLNYYQNKYLLVRRIEKILHSRMSYILSNSKMISKQLINDEKVDPKKIKLVYNGVSIFKPETKKNKNLLKKSLNIKNELILICTANLIPYKNHKVLFRSLIDQNKKWKLILIGRESNIKYRSELISFSKKLGIRKDIIFLGHQKNVIDFLNIADIGLLTSNEEGLSNSILEYLSCKIPVVATDVGGNSEIIRHHKNGFLCKKNDHLSISKHLKILLNDNKLRKKFGNCGYNLVKNKFNMIQFVENHKKIYMGLN